MIPNSGGPPTGVLVRMALVALGFWLLQAEDTEAASLHHTLLPESSLLDECPPCGRPSIAEPLRGGFDLQLLDANPVFENYTIENLTFTAGSAGGRTYKVTGRGTYTVGGEVALLQDLSLELFIEDGLTNRFCIFTNATPLVGRLWPMLLASAVQTNGTFTQVYHLQLASAPFREIWFSTVNGMSSGLPVPPAHHVSGGDLLSSAGRVVKLNRELTAGLGFMPSPEPPDLGLDALDVQPGGEVVFSVEQDAFSELLGPVVRGDLLSNRGRVVKRNQELTAAFGVMPPSTDFGLDAVQVRDDGEVYFSVRQQFLSEALGRTIRGGDLLSSRGTVVKRNEELVARFQPVDPKPDYGLDALFVWPSGEVWFSVEAGFQGQDRELYHPGDLLSDQGYVVFRNLELVAPFQPLEDLADFGLDALFVVTDATSQAAAPGFTRIQTLSNGAIALEWKGSGRVWELWESGDVLGPWLPASPVIPDLQYEAPPDALSPRFFRLSQW